MAKKTIEFKGKKYKVSHQDYGFTRQLILINREGSTSQIDNDRLDDVTAWKREVKKAILEYEDRQTTRREFEEWDGKL